MRLAPTRRRMLGLGLVGLGLTLVCLSASASLGLLTTGSITTTDAPAPATSSGSTGGTVVELKADAWGKSVPVAVGLPGAPLPPHVIGTDQHLDTASLPLPVHVSVDVAPAGGADRAATPGREATIEALAQRPVAPLAESAALGAAALAGAGFLAYFWSSIKAWGMRSLLVPAIGLYARVTHAEVFDNAVREQIYAAIRSRPGISASDLAKQASVSWGTTIYHLEVLEQNRMVSSLRKGRHRRYFENGADLNASKDVVALLQNPVTASIAQQIRVAPGTTQKDLAHATGMSPQALHWHLVRLVEAGLVRKERAGRFVKHYASA